MPDESRQLAANERGLALISAFLIVVAGALLYYSSAAMPLHGGDLERFVNDSALQRVSTWPEAMEHWPGAPLTVFGYALNQALLPSGGMGLRVTNLLLHLLCGVLLYLITRKLLPGGFPEPLAMLPGLALIAHPLCTEGVLYLSARPALQSAFFGLAATLLYLRALEKGQINPITLAGTVVLYMLAFASAFTMLGLPLVWLGLGRVCAGSHDARAARTMNFAALGAMIALFAAWSATGAPGYTGTPEGIGATLSAQARTASGLGRFFGGHDVLAGFSPESAGSAPGYAVLLACGVLGAAVFAGFRLAAPLWWAFISLAAMPCLAAPRDAFSEAYLYFPLAGLLLLLAIIPHLIPAQNIRYGVCAIAAVMLVFFGFQTWVRAAAWSDPITFWGEAALEHPDLVEPRLYQGRYLMHAAKHATDEAEAKSLLALAQTAWEAAERVDGANVEVQAALGEALLRLEETDAALEKLNAALKGDPFYPGASLLLALALEKKVGGPEDRATLHEIARNFARAGRQEKLPPALRGRYGMALLTAGDLQGALRELESAQTEEPGLPFAGAVANIRKRLGDARQLNEQALKAFQEKPDQPDGILLRARADLLNGDVRRAFYMLDRATARHQGSREIWTLLGVASAGINNAAGFLAEHPGLFDADEPFWTGLAVECAGLSYWPGAIVYLEHAAQWSPEGTPPPRAQLAGVALALQQLPVARSLAEEAARLHPEAPEPWLILAQVAIAAENKEAARDYLQEAEKRGADPKLIEQIREHGAVDMSIPQAPVRTIIR